MKNSIVALVTLALFSIAMIGCGDDAPTINVNNYLKFNAGDKFTYDYYDRDASNARDESSKKVLVWTVLRTDINFDGRNGVSEIQQIRYEADGTTPTDTTLLYFLANGQGQLQQYNLLQTVIRQFSSATFDLGPVIDQMPDTWIQISDTKSPNALTWTFPELQTTLQDINVMSLATIDAKLKMSVSSNHKGKMDHTVVAGTYTDAFITDHQTPTGILAAETKTIGPVTINDGDQIIQDSMTLHYAVSITGGILSHSMDSKQATVIPLGAPYPVNGFEMELTSVTRATTN